VKVILMGPPGSGKGTQASKLASDIAVDSISSGDLFRSNLSNNTDLGIQAKKFMDKGEYVPDDITINLSGTDIGTSLKISSVKLAENVMPTITDRDFVIATVAAPTVIKEPEKPAEETAEGAEGETPAEGVDAAAKDGDSAKKDEKGKDAAAGDKKTEEKKPAEKKPAEKK